MTRDASTLTTEQSSPTQHAMLIAWGHFARTLGLTKRLAVLPIDQKAVARAPHEKVAEFLIGLLSGIEYLSDLSAGPAPLAQDDEVATAWQLAPMADASGVSRTLAACAADPRARRRAATGERACRRADNRAQPHGGAGAGKRLPGLAPACAP